MQVTLKVNSQPLATVPTEFKVILFDNAIPVTMPKKLQYVPDQDLHRVYWPNPGNGRGFDMGIRRRATSGVIFNANDAQKFNLDCPVSFDVSDTLTLDLRGFRPGSGFKELFETLRAEATPW